MVVVGGLADNAYEASKTLMLIAKRTDPQLNETQVRDPFYLTPTLLIYSNHLFLALIHLRFSSQYVAVQCKQAICKIRRGTWRSLLLTSGKRSVPAAAGESGI